MRRLGVVVLLLAASALSGCGAQERDEAQPRDTLQPAPLIKAIDEPPEELLPPEPVKDGARAAFCPGNDSGGGDRRLDDCPSPEQVEAYRRLEWEDTRESLPTPKSPPRSIAMLALKEREPKARAMLAVWRTRAGKVCMATGLEDGDGATWGSSRGPCVSGSGCADLCLVRYGHYDYGVPPYLLSGTVSAHAEELRILFVDGQSVRYPLTGPLLPDSRSRRVFMLDLGNRSHRRLELLIGGKVVAHDDVRLSQIEADRCVQRYSTPSREPEFSACIEKAFSGSGDEE
jgi:hypothetical protein